MSRSRRLLSAAGALAFLAAGAVASEIEVEASLSPPFPAPDPNAFGQIRLEKHGAEQKFRVRGENLATQGPLTPFGVWLEDGVGTGTYFSLGSMIFESSGGGRWELELEAEGSAPPALGVADLADVAGRIVQVREAGGVETYLTGMVPNIAAGGGGGGGGGSTTQGQVSLQRPVPAPDADAFGKVELEKQGTEQEFKVDGRNLPTGSGDGFGVFVEDGVGTGTFLTVGAMSIESASQGRWELDIENHGAAPPQLGVADLSDLAGRRVEVRHLSGEVYLWAVLPSIGASAGGNVNQSSALAVPATSPPSPTAKGTVKVKLKVSQGNSFFEIKVQKGLAPNPTYVVWIEDAPGSGTFTAAGELALNSSGTKGKFRRDTKKGEALPLGVGSVLDLAGRAVEVRDGASVVHLEGVIP